MMLNLDSDGVAVDVVHIDTSEGRRRLAPRIEFETMGPYYSNVGRRLLKFKLVLQRGAVPWVKRSDDGLALRFDDTPGERLGSLSSCSPRRGAYEARVVIIEESRRGRFPAGHLLLGGGCESLVGESRKHGCHSIMVVGISFQGRYRNCQPRMNTIITFSSV